MSMLSIGTAIGLWLALGWLSFLFMRWVIDEPPRRIDVALAALFGPLFGLCGLITIGWVMACLAWRLRWKDQWASFTAWWLAPVRSAPVEDPDDG